MLPEPLSAYTLYTWAHGGLLRPLTEHTEPCACVGVCKHVGSMYDVHAHILHVCAQCTGLQTRVQCVCVYTSSGRCAHMCINVCLCSFHLVPNEVHDL